MRTIKFRAWLGKEMLHDELIVWTPDCELKGGTKLNTAIKKFQEEEDFVLMQFTGLTDKNGVEIFEGDIIQGEHLRGAVCFGEFSNNIECYECSHEDDFIGWYVSDKAPRDNKKEWKRALDSYANQCEIIGNIHEHPHLLNPNEREVK